jgi:hypothetical protein
MREHTRSAGAALVVFLVLVFPCHAFSQGLFGTAATTQQNTITTTSPLVTKPAIRPQGSVTGMPTALTMNASPQNVGGETSTVTVFLPNPAPVEGAKVIVDMKMSKPNQFQFNNIVTWNCAQGYQAYLTIPAGQQSGTFTVASYWRVSSRMSLDMTASYGNQTAVYTLFINPSDVRALTIKTKPIYSGQYTDAEVFTTYASPKAFLDDPINYPPVVTLTTSDAGATSFSNTAQGMPNSVIVPAGTTSATFRIVAGTVSAPKTVTISAQMNGKTVSDTLTIYPKPK